MASQPFTPSHPYAEIFPLHDEGPAFAEFCEDIKANKLLEPIIKFEGMVLDGRRRERGCRKAGIDPRYKEFTGTREDALAFVMSKNLHRRHLGEGERAIVAARYATAKVGRVKQEPLGNQSHQIDAINPTNKDSAEKFDVSETTLDRAKKVLANGTPALQEAVIDGTLSVSDAASVAGSPAKTQDKAVEAVKSGKATTAKSAIKSPPADDELAPEEETELEADDAVLDDDKIPVPAKLRSIFAQVGLFRSAAAYCAKTAIALDKVEKSRAYALTDRQAASEKGDRRVYSTVCRTAEKKMIGLRPAKVCCAEGCEKCGKKGYLTHDEVQK